MKHNLVYIISFVMAFALVTLGLIVMTQSYRNVFAFDFSPPPKPVKTINFAGVSKDEIKKIINEEVKKEIADSVKARKVVVEKGKIKKENDVKADSIMISRLNKVETALRQMKNNVENKNGEIESLQKKIKTKNDTEYAEWLKSTVKIYESMDSQKAAQIITSISDNKARDILYKMKNKKAAEILSYLNPELVVKLTGTKQ